MLPAVVERRFT